MIHSTAQHSTATFSRCQTSSIGVTGQALIDGQAVTGTYGIGTTQMQQ